jgi:predicted transcriptional regulator
MGGKMMLEGELSRREREVMAIIHRLGQATAAQLRSEMEDPPTDAAVRSVLRILVRKGHLEHEYEGPRYLYSPTVPQSEARRAALDNVIRTFFDGSAEGVMAAFLEARGTLTPEEGRRLRELIDQAEEEGR